MKLLFQCNKFQGDVLSKPNLFSNTCDIYLGKFEEKFHFECSQVQHLSGSFEIVLVQTQ